MLFTVNGCRRKAVRRRSPQYGACLRTVISVFASLVSVLLLLLAPQWLLVLLILILSAALVITVSRR